MAETLLGSLGIETAGTERSDLLMALQHMQGHKLRFSLHDNAYTILVEFQARLTGVKRREELVEAGHLTIQQVSYQLVNDAQVVVLIGLDDITAVEYDQNFTYLSIYLHRLYWHLTAI